MASPAYLLSAAGVERKGTAKARLGATRLEGSRDDRHRGLHFSPQLQSEGAERRLGCGDLQAMPPLHGRRLDRTTGVVGAGDGDLALACRLSFLFFPRAVDCCKLRFCGLSFPPISAILSR